MSNSILFKKFLVVGVCTSSALFFNSVQAEGLGLDSTYKSSMNSKLLSIGDKLAEVESKAISADSKADEALVKADSAISRASSSCSAIPPVKTITGRGGDSCAGESCSDNSWTKGYETRFRVSGSSCVSYISRRW